MQYHIHHSQFSYVTREKFVRYVQEKHPDAVFVTELALKTQRGGYTSNTGAIYYQENPPAPHTNKFFSLYQYPNSFDGEVGRWAITGLQNFDPVVAAILTKESADLSWLTYSRFGHDFVYDPTGTAFIDGGREYTRTGGAALPQVVRLNLFTKTFELDGETLHAE